MSDILKYRIPGEKIIEQTGVFEISENEELTNGFIISNFTLKTVYQFKEQGKSHIKEKLYFGKGKLEVIEKENYLDLAQQFLNAFNLFGIKKAVFSRIKRVDFDESKTLKLFEELEKCYPKAFVYLVSSKLFGTWVGASPEILLNVQNNSGFTMSLAGTKQSSDSTEWGQKELEEQEYVTSYIFDKLNQTGHKNLDLIGPYDFIAGPVQHLRTDISFDMGENSVLDITKLLHPTPAVSGLPQEQAIDLITALEKHNRAFYTGVIGGINKEKSAIYVNLRCCKIKKGAAYLYVGGGFTRDSNPESEWEETENKSKTILNILQKL